MNSILKPVKVYPDELEMEALAAGAIRALTGQEEGKVYDGKAIWSGFKK